MTMTQLLHKNMVAQLMPNQGTAVPMMKMMVSLNQLQQFGFCCQYNVVIILNVGPFFCKVDNDLGDGSGGAKAGADVPGGSGD